MNAAAASSLIDCAVRPWSDQEYRAILRKFAPTVCDYRDVTGRDRFCLIRHDAEYTLSRALRQAALDAEEGVVSTIFVQTISNAYNPLSVENGRRIRAMIDMGHHVGLHFYTSHLETIDAASVGKELDRQIATLQQVVPEGVDRFSFHRPSRAALTLTGFHHPSIINAYAPQYFELTEPGQSPKTIKYLADSQHRWKYGHPLDSHPHSKFQMLLHPDEWTVDGSGTLDNFRQLLAENSAEYDACLDDECQHYRWAREGQADG